MHAVAVDLGWSLRCEVHRALGFEGDLPVDDPDGIVIDAAFAHPDECSVILASCAPWVGEPLADWLAQRWGPSDAREYVYEVSGSDRRELRATSVAQERGA